MMDIIHVTDNEYDMEMDIYIIGEFVIDVDPEYTNVYGPYSECDMSKIVSYLTKTYTTSIQKINHIPTITKPPIKYNITADEYIQLGCFAVPQSEQIAYMWNTPALDTI